MKLSLSHLGVFKVLVHRDFPLDKVKRVIVKLTPPRGSTSPSWSITSSPSYLRLTRSRY
ncbi:hypothetical protein IC006_0972 [Sulfuracidifex tepidarius]|uniref:Uncharacterized protein n=1 Tax=Sulfuracidifex tepidarius TaxID=1294262 RepID=A0A510DU53_9CREN|nr:hypothetical protein IC006_0972 [Sulfuracidifex tepidarius]